MAQENIIIPDLGGASDVEVIEILVKPGEHVEAETPIMTLEGDKATMDVPSPKAGVVVSVAVTVGDKVNEGDAMMVLDSELTDAASQTQAPEQVAAPIAPSVQTIDIVIPDLGGAADVDVIEINVAVGDNIDAEASLITLEGDKATMEVPSSEAGTITALTVHVGDKVSEGDVIGQMQMQAASQDSPVAAPVAASTASVASSPSGASSSPSAVTGFVDSQYAGPAVRRLARELDIDLRKVKGTGNKGRITKDDIKAYLSGGHTANAGSNFPFKLAPVPKVDFAKFGDIETQPLNKIKRATAANMHRNWVGIPHVTQFDHADITAMEAYRQKHKAGALDKGVRLTPIAFIIKAMVAALRQFPQFNASLDATGENLILKKYVHIGVAVDTPNGLVVPVLKNVDQKSTLEIARELGQISAKARDEGLALKDMQGGSMTISSLGGIGGTAFTPIINAPEVAILGVSKSAMMPVFDKASGEFTARLMLPLSLSYDHRVIDGAEAARFIVYLSQQLADVESLIL